MAVIYSDDDCYSLVSSFNVWDFELSALCMRGFASSTGSDPCFPCPAGHYQPRSGENFCHRYVNFIFLDSFNIKTLYEESVD